MWLIASWAHPWFSLVVVGGKGEEEELEHSRVGPQDPQGQDTNHIRSLPAPVSLACH